MRLLRAATIGVVVTLVAAVSYVAVGALRDRAETNRTTERFDPPVWAGQNVPGPCASGGFYARDGEKIVLTIAAHCLEAIPGTALRDSEGRLVGTFGRPAAIADCPKGRLCLAADILGLELPPDRIPWGHLNLVDMGAGGYRTLGEDTRPLTCADIHKGDRIEVDGRERYRTGTVIEIGRYEHPVDAIFPCMVVTDVEGGSGDSGSAVLIDGQPAGTTSRVIGRYLAFTPLAEGLANLGLELCTAPDCDLSPTAAPEN
ncbi:MAG TPA: hypothetical protein VM121_07380 [Acidimicrobiales bacterium]|nr:hypothetical protein [Acidimicrobiales bacterium]